MLEADIDKNNKKIYDVDKEINIIQKGICRRKQKKIKIIEIFPRDLMS